MLCCKDKKKLQKCLNDLYCDKCDIGVCGCCKDVATNVCDCCVDPMESLIKQLQNILPQQATILITFTNGSQDSFMVQDIVLIKDSIINLLNSQFISICDISRVRWRNTSTIDQIELLPPVCTCGECDCCERPLREQLSKQIGNNIALEFLGEKDPQSSASGEEITLRKVGLGIIVGENLNDGAPDAYSICKILRIGTLLR